MDTDFIKRRWESHGRTVVLAGSLLLPLFVASPLFDLPFGSQISYGSPVGVLYQVIRGVPGLMTSAGFLIWLAWRSGWHPTHGRARLMLMAAFVALVILPVALQALERVTAMQPSEGLAGALSMAWRDYASTYGLMIGVSSLVRAITILLVLRIAYWSRLFVLTNPENGTPVARPQFSIGSLLSLTAIIAIAIVGLPRLLPLVLSPFQADYAVRLVNYLAAGTFNSLVIGSAMIATAAAKLRSNVYLVPALAAIVAVLVPTMHVVDRLQAWAFYDGDPSRDFQLIQYLPYPISLVTATYAVLVLFQTLGLELTRPSLVESKANE